MNVCKALSALFVATLLSSAALAEPTGSDRVTSNLLVNADFHTSLTGWTEEQHSNFTSNWNTRDYQGSETSGSLRAEGKTPGSPYIGDIVWQCFDVTPGDLYYFGAWARVHPDADEDASNLGYIFAANTEPGTCPTSVTYGNDNATFGNGRKAEIRPSDATWIRRVSAYTIPQDVSRIRLSLAVFAADSGTVGDPGNRPNVLAIDHAWFGREKPSLQTALSISDVKPHQGQPFDITLTLTNSGRNSARNITAWVRNGERLRLVSESCPGTLSQVISNNERQFRWTGMGELAAGASISCTFTAEVGLGLPDRFSVEATVFSSDGNLHYSDGFSYISMESKGVPDLRPAITLGPHLPSAGDELEVQLTFANIGSASGTATARLDLDQDWAFLSSNCPDLSGFSGRMSGYASAPAGSSYSCSARFRIPANFGGVVNAVIELDAAVNEWDTTNNNAQASERVVYLLVNRVIDGFDLVPGDGICEATAGSGDCSLRAAVMEANALGGGRLIEVPYSSFAYQLTRTVGDDEVLKGDINIRKTMTIRGIPNATGGVPLLSAAFPSNAADRVFSVDTGSSSATVIENFMIAGQNLSPPTNDGTSGNGGLIHQASGKLILRNLRLRNGRSETGFGGAVYSADELTVDRVRMHDNAAKHAGALAMVRGGYAFFKVVDSEFYNNASSATGSAGAIYINAQDSLLAIQRSTLHGNQAAWGGAITIAKTLGTSLLQSTISGNTAASGGGGIYISSTNVSIGSSTIWNNQAAPGDDAAGLGGGIYRGATATVTLHNSILANNMAQTRGTAPFLFPYAANCYPSLSSDGYNSLGAVGSDTVCEVTATTGDHFDTAPALAALADNGGPTLTHAFVSPGNEVNRGNPECRALSGGGVMTSDQRGALRPADGRAEGTPRCDKGAYELSNSARVSVTKPGDGSGSVYSTPTGISCGATCSAVYAFGTEVELTASSSPGSSFAGWDGDCAHAGTARCTVSAQGDVQVTAIFTANASTYTLSVDLGEGGTGNVVSDPTGIDCPVACSAAFDAGSSVTLTATPTTDSVFLGFYGANCGGTSDPCTVSMNGNRSVSAAFDIDYSDLVVTMAGGGVGRVVSTPIGIDCPGDCQEKYAVTGTVTLNAQPSVGSVFGGWSGACTGTGACTLDMDLGPHAVTATFEMEPDMLFHDGFE